MKEAVELRVNIVGGPSNNGHVTGMLIYIYIYENGAVIRQV